MLPGSVHSSFRDSLFRGRYRLLLGSGISMGATNLGDEKLRSAWELTRDLCKRRNVPETSLSRVTKSLSPEIIKSEITDHYSLVEPSLAHTLMPKFLWHEIFTFNVDDGIQRAYEKAPRVLQSLIPKNFPEVFSGNSSRTQVPLIHLHGCVRWPGAGYVFSINDYAQISAETNPWMVYLADSVTAFRLGSHRSPFFG